MNLHKLVKTIRSRVRIESGEKVPLTNKIRVYHSAVQEEDLFCIRHIYPAVSAIVHDNNSNFMSSREQAIAVFRNGAEFVVPHELMNYFMHLCDYRTKLDYVDQTKLAQQKAAFELLERACRR